MTFDSESTEEPGGFRSAPRGNPDINAAFSPQKRPPPQVPDESGGPEHDLDIVLQLYAADLEKVDLMIGQVDSLNLSNPMVSSAFFSSLNRLGVTLSNLAHALGVNHGSLSRWAREEGLPSSRSHARLKTNLRAFLIEYRRILEQHMASIQGH